MRVRVAEHPTRAVDVEDGGQHARRAPRAARSGPGSSPTVIHLVVDARACSIAPGLGVIDDLAALLRRELVQVRRVRGRLGERLRGGLEHDRGERLGSGDGSHAKNLPPAARGRYAGRPDFLCASPGHGCPAGRTPDGTAGALPEVSRCQNQCGFISVLSAPATSRRETTKMKDATDPYGNAGTPGENQAATTRSIGALAKRPAAAVLIAGLLAPLCSCSGSRSTSPWGGPCDQPAQLTGRPRRVTRTKCPRDRPRPRTRPIPARPSRRRWRHQSPKGPRRRRRRRSRPSRCRAPDVVVESAATPDAEVTPAPTPPPEHAPVALAAPTPAAPISASSLPANPVLAAPDTATVESMRERSRPPARRTGPSSTSSRPQAQTTPNVVPAPRPSAASHGARANRVRRWTVRGPSRRFAVDDRAAHARRRSLAIPGVRRRLPCVLAPRPDADRVPETPTCSRSASPSR